VSNPDQEFIDAKIHYKQWVLLKFMKSELQYQSSTTPDMPEISQRELMRISCSSMAVNEMTTDVMLIVLNQLVDHKILRPKLHSAVVFYTLTNKGNLETRKLFKEFHTFVDSLDNIPNISNKKYLKIRQLVNSLSGKMIDKNTDEILISLINTVLIDFTLHYLILEFVLTNL